MRYRAVVSILLLAGVIAMISGQSFPSTIKMPVTFYDFHSNGSNPEFEPNNNGGVFTGMVQPTLDAQKKPVRGSTPFFNYYIQKWGGESGQETYTEPFNGAKV